MQQVCGGGHTTHRESNLELYRILVMLAIIAHHYVVNSGLMTVINQTSALSFPSIFLLLYGCWGKIGINCFVLITGYFMCTSNITVRKFLKLFLEWMFYKYVIWLIFILTGYQTLTLKEAIKNLLPIRTLTDGFTSCYIVFYLFIPFLNILIHAMSEKQHRMLLLLSLGVFSVFPSIPLMEVSSNYVIWFMVLYLVSSYIRLYPIALLENVRFWGWMSFLAVICSYISVIVMAWVKDRFGYSGGYYYFLSDSNKITALAVAISFFLFFKNWKLKYNPIINRIAASTFGVLCIHAHSDAMRQWLWKDVCNNVGFFNSPYLVLHAVGVVLAIFTACTLIDQMRTFLLERLFFKFYDQKVAIKFR